MPGKKRGGSWKTNMNILEKVMKESQIKIGIKSKSEYICKGLYKNKKGLCAWLFLCLNKPDKEL